MEMLLLLFVLLFGLAFVGFVVQTSRLQNSQGTVERLEDEARTREKVLQQALDKIDQMKNANRDRERSDSMKAIWEIERNNAHSQN